VEPVTIRVRLLADRDAPPGMASSSTMLGANRRRAAQPAMQRMEDALEVQPRRADYGRVGGLALRRLAHELAEQKDWDGQLQRLAEQTARERRQPGWITATQVLAVA
jgi:hypothetical protein